ncbi:hypothetical protein V6N13_138196 [Hibiscus sabdariffa]
MQRKPKTPEQLRLWITKERDRCRNQSEKHGERTPCVNKGKPDLMEDLDNVDQLPPRQVMKKEFPQPRKNQH